MSAITCKWLRRTCAGQTDVKAVVDQEIAQEIARLEAKIDAVIGMHLLAHNCFEWFCNSIYNTCLTNVGKRSSGRQANTASDNPELRLEDLSRQIAQLRKGKAHLPMPWLMVPQTIMHCRNPVLLCSQGGPDCREIARAVAALLTRLTGQHICL